MRIENAQSISEAFEKAVSLIGQWRECETDYYWFRGINDREYNLVPGGYWRKDYDETDVMLDFSQEGGMFATLGALNDWQTLYSAQHHGVPTRLLDWTESFSSALFFAFDRWDGKTTPCIWICRPAQLNRITTGWKGIISPENNSQLAAWTPHGIRKPYREAAVDDASCTYDNDWPIAIYPKRLESRLHAQQGMFTVHGRRSGSLTDIVIARGTSTEDVFARIDLVNFSLSMIKSELRWLGIRRSAIFPDLSNFVGDLKDRFGWS